jgi:kinesin family protein 5
MLCTCIYSSQRAFAVTSAGIEGGKNLAESAQDLERTRKAINVQLAEFDGVKKSLIRDLQNRCEKVIKYLIQSYGNCIDIFFL